MQRISRLILLSAIIGIAGVAEAHAQSRVPAIYGTQHRLPNTSTSQAAVPVPERLKQCWSRLPDGRRLPTVTIVVSLAQDGSLIHAKLPNSAVPQYNRNPAYREATDRAFNAIRRCTPLRPVPSAPYNVWQSVMVIFGS